MAIRNADGSIILTTKIDTSGIQKGTTNIKSGLQKVKNAFGSLAEQRATLIALTQAIKDQKFVLNSLNVEYSEYVAKGQQYSAKAHQLKAEINNLTAEMREMETAAITLGNKGANSMSKIGSALKTLVSYFIGIQTIFATINFSKEASEFATQTEASVKRLTDIYGEASQAVGDFIDKNARAIGLSKSAGTSIASTYGNLLSVWADQATNAQLTNALLNQTAVVASRMGRTTTDVAERIRSGLLGNTEAIEDLGINVNIKTIEITEAFKRIADGRSWEQLTAYEQAQVRTLAILEQSTNKYGTTVANTSATTRNSYRAAFEDFKATWGQIINTVLVPVLRVATMVLNVLTRGLQILAGITGKTISTTNAQAINSSNTEKAIGGAVDNQNDLTKATKNTAKEQKKMLANFDEINTLNQESNAGGAGGAVGAGGIGGGLEIGDFGFGNLKPIGEEISQTLATIMAAVGLALVAVGLILMFYGKFAWGIGFIIAGAAIFSVSAAALSETDYGKKVISILTTIMAVAGGALLALGIILLYLGGIVGKGVAIGMIIAGASLIVGAVATKAGLDPKDIKGWLNIILGIAGGALLALGIILCMVGSVSLGVGLIIAGAVSLVSVVALNFDTVTSRIKGWVAVIMGIAGAALLVLGIVLCVTGVGLPLGIALIAAGAVAFVTPIALNWNYIVDKIKDVWNKIKAFWNVNIAKYFTASWWGNLGKTAINGLIRWVVNGLNRLIDRINSFGFNLPEILGGGHIGFNVSHLSIPQLARGAVLPGGKPFLAWVNDQPKGQTNIEAPLDTIKQGLAEVLAQYNVNNGFKGRIEIPLIINGREIARAVREAENDMGKQTVFGGFSNAY